jgi:hypothetical protein
MNRARPRSRASVTVDPGGQVEADLAAVAGRQWPGQGGLQRAKAVDQTRARCDRGPCQAIVVDGHGPLEQPGLADFESDHRQRIDHLVGQDHAFKSDFGRTVQPFDPAPEVRPVARPGSRPGPRAGWRWDRVSVARRWLSQMLEQVPGQCAGAGAQFQQGPVGADRGGGFESSWRASARANRRPCSGAVTKSPAAPNLCRPLT